ncbi:MAG TPA: flagellar biosynthesis protein FlhA [Solirubrobacteraceae bacterium]|jgi:flagellar biosynthesis protein FlhA|nr:flagellar biosynthesis protein FlhA [Solirubrobacteraceae bacterium]
MNEIAKRLTRHTDLVAATGVVVLVVMMIVPLPPALIDVLITLNISAALAIVVASMYLGRALDLAAFPSLLLLTTLFRLAINVSVTRLILLHGDAGSVVRSFGHFVVGGNVVVGLVIFLVLVVIQLIVVTNGAGRVAEVAARFTLDAMPGKQMAIDADLNAGQISDEEARARREEIRREADFYGAMDGASKFVKGDAMAAVVITAINLFGGIVVGVLQHKMSLSDAAQTFSLLTVGDGLAAQIPALLISVATGIVVTRATSEGDLGTDIVTQVMREPRTPLVAGGAIAAFALVPALPKVPFLLVGGTLLLVGRRRLRTRREEAAASEQRALETRARPSESTLEAGPIDPLELTIGFGLVPMVDEASGGSLLARVRSMRRQIATELGVIIPPVRIRDDIMLDSHEYAVRVRGAEVTRGRTMAGHHLAMDPGDAAGRPAGVETVEPAFGLPAIWVPDSGRAEAEALGYTVVDPESVVITHLTETVRRHVADLLTRQETSEMLERLKETDRAAVEELVPDVLTIGEVQRVLQALLAEGVSVRDLGTIVEALGDRARVTRDPAALAEHARQALGRAITAGHVDAQLRLRAIALDPVLEQELAEALTQTPDGELLALDPHRAADVVELLKSEAERAVQPGMSPVLLCSARVRRHVRRLLAQALPQLPVCSYEEIVPGIRVETVGMVTA